jgi:DNA-binding beta-propeller fold protein YncE
MRNAIWLTLCLFLAATASAQTSPGYAVTQRHVLGGEGGWDYLTWDAAGERLFITRGTHVIVVDSATGKQTGEIPNTAGVHGVALAPDLGKGFISDGRENKVTVFDLKTLATLATVDVGKVPDAICYEPKTKRVFTFNARGNDATAIDATTNKVLGAIALGGKPEFAVADGKGRLFVNIETTAELVEIDPAQLAVKARWPMHGCTEPSGLALDVKHGRLFAGCDNKVMAIVDAKSGALVATLPIGAGVDAVTYDPDKKLAFSSNGEGTLTVVHEDSPDKFTVVETLPTERGARTHILDPATHRVYTVTAGFGPAPAATAENPRPRPTIVPGSFVLLVIDRQK